MNARVASLIRAHLPADEPVHRSGDEGTNGPAAAVRAFEELPDFVRHARFRQVNERILDTKLFETIVSQRPIRDDETDWAGRLTRSSLSAFDRYFCIYSRLNERFTPESRH